LEKDGRPTQNYHVLREYRKYLVEEDQLVLKVPQVIFAQKLRRGGNYVVNEAYLNAAIFTNQFYKPAVELLGSNLSAFIFEQEYQRKQERLPVEEMAAA
jgi:superfamily II RNA helicase